MSRRRNHAPAFGSPALTAPRLLSAQPPADARHPETFDGKDPVLVRGPANVTPVKEESHLLTQQNAHSLPSSEYLRISAGPTDQLDPYVYYSYPTPRAPVSDDLTVRVWVRANRRGVKLLARLVLPREGDPANPGVPMTALLRGGEYSGGTGYWEPLELRRPAKLLKDEQQALQVKLGRAVNVADAYIDRVVLNL